MLWIGVNSGLPAYRPCKCDSNHNSIDPVPCKFKDPVCMDMGIQLPSPAPVPHPLTCRLQIVSPWVQPSLHCPATQMATLQNWTGGRAAVNSVYHNYYHTLCYLHLLLMSNI